MAIAILLIAAGLPLLVWSSGKFVDGAVGVAHCLGMSPLLIGIIVVGFGTSIPEILVSALAAWQGNPHLALGNAYGSNITNIGLILGLTAIMRPIGVQSHILRRELPILTAITGIALLQLFDGRLSLYDSIVLLLIFSFLIGWSIRQGLVKSEDNLGAEVAQLLPSEQKPLGRPLFQLAFGMVLLIVSSKMLVVGAVNVATALGVSDLLIGLTVMALGTSLPELASSLAAALKGEHDIALGNVIGSNMFNSLMVVGIAGVINPFEVPTMVLVRDLPVMAFFTVSLFLWGFGQRGKGRINRYEGGLLLAMYIGYMTFITSSRSVAIS
jgi:cation:H+ antiporter